MIACQNFRDRYVAGSDEAALLEHVRACDGCLDFAIGVDPDVMFRAIGGAELVPPGGVDAFVEDVMHSVRLREAETSMTRHHTVAWPRRLAVAATFAAGIMGVAFFYEHEHHVVPAALTAAVRPGASAIQPTHFATKPIVDTYDSDKATIMEMPTEGTSDVQVVMIVDERLPADL